MYVPLKISSSQVPHLKIKAVIVFAGNMSALCQVMSAKLLPRLDLLSIMPLTVQKVLIQNIVKVIKGALHLNIDHR